MMVRLEIICDNDAFGDEPNDSGYEVARILCVLARDLQHEGLEETVKILYDANGNKVGKYIVTNE